MLGFLRHRRRWLRMREDLLDALDAARPRARSMRISSPVLVVVQSRLPGTAADQLIDARERSEHHQHEAVRKDPPLGRSAPPDRSAWPALLHVLPSGAGRGAADLRRGRAHPRNPGDPPIPETRDRSTPMRATTTSSVDLQLPAWARGRQLRPFPDQAGGRRNRRVAARSRPS